MPSLTFDSPLGPLSLVERAGALAVLDFGRRSNQPDTPLLRSAKQQLDEYFAGTRKQFDLPLAPQGTDFDRALWFLLREIPYGELRTYGALAARLEADPRAVGGACGRNPLPILIPCHRVVGGHSLGGYSGSKGLATKRRLLALEHSDPRSLPLFAALA